MKILVFTVTAWNSKVGANTWETLLEQYGSENVANVIFVTKFLIVKFVQNILQFLKIKS